VATPVAFTDVERMVELSGGAMFLAESWTDDTALTPPTISDVSGTADMTDRLYPASAMWDRSLGVFAKAQEGSGANAVFCRFREGKTIDTVMAYVDPRGQALTLAVQLDDVTIGSVDVNSARRVVVAAPQRYTDVTTVSVSWAGAEMWCSEIMAGERLRLSRPPTAWDDRPYGAEVREFVSPARARHQYAYGSGFQDHRGRFVFTGDDQFGHDDLATLRALQWQSRGAARPVLFRPPYRPPGPPGPWLFGIVGGIPRLPFQDWVAREWRFAFEEDAPPALREFDGATGAPLNV